MAIFLDVNQIYRMMQRELPEGAYADGAPSGFFTTASIYSKSSLIEQAYENLEVIYANIFPQEADEKQADWEIKVFGNTLDGSLPLATRRQKVIEKLRTKPGITAQDMIDIVQSVIGTDKDVAIGEWGCESGTWIIGVSELGVTTILGGTTILDVTPSLFPGVDFCTADPSVFGKTDEEWAEMQQEAYTFSVLIYSYTLTAAEREAVDLALTAGEPARSAHVIYDGLDPSEHI